MQMILNEKELLKIVSDFLVNSGLNCHEDNLEEIKFCVTPTTSSSGEISYNLEAHIVINSDDYIVGQGPYR